MTSTDHSRAPGDADSALPEATLKTRRSRWWTSWPIWQGALLVGATLIAAMLTIPFVRRGQALNYFDDHDIAYEFFERDAWITESFGEWARPWRRVKSINLVNPLTVKMFRQAARFGELEELGLSTVRLSPPMFAIMHEMPKLKTVTLFGCPGGHFWTTRHTLEENWTVVDDCYYHYHYDYFH